MGKVFHKLFYHAIWATEFREPSIKTEWEDDLYAILKDKAARLGCYVYACGGTEDHVHMVLTIPPGKSIGSVIGELKGSSAFMVNRHICGGTRSLAWQDGYGILTASESDLPRLIQYVERQKEHHRQQMTIKDLEISADDEHGTKEMLGQT